MKKPVKANIKFKDYSPGQTMLLPPSLDEMIDANHPVRIVNRVIDQVEIDFLIEKFKGGGTSSYHPRMLLKVIVFAYLSNIYSSRRMEAALKENIYFMWISGMSQPDHNTLNRENRIIEVNHHLKSLKEKARALLRSEEGISYRKTRCADVEPVFGNIKCNKGFKRFMLKGCEKVEIEAGLLSIAHNLKKCSC
jgi:transposase